MATEVEIARMCHEVNRGIQKCLGEEVSPHWEAAPDWQQRSALAGVRLHLAGEANAEASHQSWMAQKVADGWVFGEVKDAEAKTHPCLVSYDELPVEQKIKDFVFGAVVAAMKE